MLALPNPAGPIRSGVGAELRASSALLGKFRAALVPMTTSREGSHIMQGPNDRCPRREGHEEGYVIDKACNPMQVNQVMVGKASPWIPYVDRPVIREICEAE